MDSSRHVAEAINGRDARQTLEGPNRPRTVEPRWPTAAPPMARPSPNHEAFQFQRLFGEASKRKVLCTCGAIAEVDTRIAGTKSRLGKALECRRCRNERVAMEREELERHFAGEDENEDWRARR